MEQRWLDKIAKVNEGEGRKGTCRTVELPYKIQNEAEERRKVNSLLTNINIFLVP